MLTSDPAPSAAGCIAALREGRPADAAPTLAAVSARLRDPRLPTGEAERFAREVLAAHLAALEAQGGWRVPGVWSRGLGPGGFDMLCDYLACARVEQEPLEWACTELRAALSASVEQGGEAVRLAAALGIQAFRLEYAWPESAAEAARASAVAAALEASLAAGRAPEPSALARLSMYRPLYGLRGIEALVAPAATSALASDGALAELLRVQVSEPLRERALVATIRSLTPVNDRLSREVQAQYEANPYPRWHRLPGLQGPAGAEAKAGPEGTLLIAGCGTGRQALSAALAAPRRRVLGIDLSRVSLAYAARKAAEIGVPNLELAHADLLELPAAGLRFDAISSTGVLHHLRDPAEGLRALRALMAHDEGLKVAVYTESGRRGVVAAIDLREAYQLAPTPEGIRTLRQIVAAQPEGHPAREILGYADFYSLSGVRDLVFHVMEHRYTLPSFAALADRAGLCIRQILAPVGWRERFLARFPQPGAAGDAEAWHRFEQENPGCFGSMYRLMLGKA